MVNQERFMVKLLAHVAGKPNHGRQDLLVTIARLQEECEVPDDLYREVLARFGDEVADAVLARIPPATPPVNTSSGSIRGQDAPSIARYEHEGDTHAGDESGSAPGVPRAAGRRGASRAAAAV